MLRRRPSDNNRYFRAAKVIGKTRYSSNKALNTFIVIILVTLLVAVWLYTSGYFEVIKGAIEARSTTSVSSTKGGAGTVDASGQYYHDGYEDSVNNALAVIDSIPVYDKNTSTGYSRNEEYDFPNYDFDNSGCNTREDIRMTDLTDVTANKCAVQSGILAYDPYTGAKNVVWSRKKAATLQVEHIVALENADSTGADLWGTANGSVLDSKATSAGASTDPSIRKKELASDPLNLILVDGPENESKGSQSADTWLVPNNPEYRCEYSARQVLVKAKYGLYFTTAEHKALVDTLNSCKK